MLSPDLFDMMLANENERLMKLLRNANSDVDVDRGGVVGASTVVGCRTVSAAIGPDPEIVSAISVSAAAGTTQTEFRFREEVDSEKRISDRFFWMTSCG